MSNKDNNSSIEQFTVKELNDFCKETLAHLILKANIKFRNSNIHQHNFMEQFMKFQNINFLYNMAGCYPTLEEPIEILENIYTQSISYFKETYPEKK